MFCGSGLFGVWGFGCRAFGVEVLAAMDLSARLQALVYKGSRAWGLGFRI